MGLGGEEVENGIWEGVGMNIFSIIRPPASRAEPVDAYALRHQCRGMTSASATFVRGGTHLECVMPIAYIGEMVNLVRGEHHRHS